MMRTCLLSFLLIFCSLSWEAHACRGNETDPSEPFKQAYKNASIVFIGTILSVREPKGKDIQATFEVVRQWKGRNKTLKFTIQTGRSCDLGRYAETGSRWFILANKEGERILTASHSRRLFDDQEEQSQITDVEQATRR